MQVGWGVRMVTQACLPWVSTAFLVAQTRKLAMWFSTKFTAKDLSSVLLSCMVFVLVVCCIVGFVSFALPMRLLDVNDFLCDGILVLVFLPQLVGSASRLISSHSPQTGELRQEG